MGFFSSIAGPVLGAAIGGLSGSKSGGSTTVDNTPTIYKGKEGEELLGNVRGGFGSLLSRGTEASNTPFQPILMQRVAAPKSPFEQLFSNPEMLAIQRDSDNNYFQSIIGNQPAQESPAEVAPAVNPNDIIAGKDAWAKIAEGMGKRGGVFDSFNQYATQDDFASLGKLLNNATRNSFTGTWQTPDGGMVDPNSITNIITKFARYN